ncbi:hypothetical protein F5I97DRAFT_1936214 [Phlebopus sp. FC_14]|nr:hypothetical protein F5I97DRAFT_1936214 [Phlebopus sp. FC_14]
MAPINLRPPDDYTLVSSYNHLLTHSKFSLTLRSQEGRYHSLILFRLSASHETPSDGASQQSQQYSDPSLLSPHQLYAMESACPHLGADMSHAEIEECDTTVVAVCPWHRYDFDLRTGESETGLRACTYAVRVSTDDADGVKKVWVEPPSDGTKWRLVELRPVSEEFADPPPITATPAPTKTALPVSVEEGLVPSEGAPPSTLMEWAVVILNTANPMLKVERTKHAVHLFRTGQLTSIGHKSRNVPKPPVVPPRDDSYTRNTVDPRKLGKRKNAAVMLHALANIEQWAWDIMESKHFSLLVSRLAATSPSTPYGSLPVHAGLWDSATVTSHSLRARLAIIHLVHEARGLDVNPGTIERFRRAGDTESVKALEIIHADEVTHVTSGHRWFMWMCDRQGADPVSTFREEVRRGWRGDIKGPFNVEARETAGMTRDFYEDLRGEMDHISNDDAKIKDVPNGPSEAPLRVGYE